MCDLCKIKNGEYINLMKILFIELELLFIINVLDWL